MGIGDWEEDLGTRRIGDKGKDLFQVLTSCPPLPPAPLMLLQWQLRHQRLKTDIRQQR